MNITDKQGNVIISWITGDSTSIVVTDKADELGYSNLRTEINSEGYLVVRGLLHDEEYTLSETKPADGFVTAESITFKLVEGKDAEGNIKTDAVIKNADGSYGTNQENKIIMADDTTKVSISKTGVTGKKELVGAILNVKDKETGMVIDEWTSGKEQHMIEGKLIVGKTYILTERIPANGFATANSIEFTIADTGVVQQVHMVDQQIKVKLIKIDSKSKKRLSGAEFVFKLKGKIVAKVTTNKKGEATIKGKLIAGKTYVVEETKAPKGYDKAKKIKFTVKDTDKEQIIKIKDKRSGDATPSTPTWSDSGAKAPKTGDMSNIWFWLMSFMGSAACAGYTGIKLRKERNVK